MTEQLLVSAIGADVWSRSAVGRIDVPMRPERIQSLLMIIPAASGDIALATTLVRHVKQVNPACLIDVATCRENMLLAQACPGVSRIIEFAQPPGSRNRKDPHGLRALSRRAMLQQFAGEAELVVYLCPYPENIDLIETEGLTLLDAIWLLAGADAVGSRHVWLLSGLADVNAAVIVKGALDNGRRRRGWWRALMPFQRPRPASIDFDDDGALSSRFVILSTEANSLPPMPLAALNSLCAALKRSGRTILHNVRAPQHTAAGTFPLICSYREFIRLRESGIPFIGWRSGLCDVACASAAPICVLYPTDFHHCRDITAAYGLRAMGTAAHCLEITIRRNDVFPADLVLTWLKEIYDNRC